MPTSKRIIFDAERMKYPYTGLYTYCYYLGKSIQEQLINTAYKIDFYVPKSALNIFGTETNYVNQNSLHKFTLPLNKKYAIWHNTYQNSNYFPPSKTPILLTIHDLNFLYDDKKGAIKQKLYLKQLQKNIDRAAQIVTISNSTLKDVKQFLEVDDKKISVIYNGCSITQLNDINNPNYLPNTDFLFTIGTIVDKKNFHVLPCLLVNNNMQLIIAGITSNENYKQQIITEAKKHGVENRVVFVGSISENDKQWYYKNCKAFVFPSIAEGFGLPVIEAMSFGAPTILSKHTCLPEIGGSAAYYFDDFEAATMQKNLTHALNDYTVNNKRIEIIKRSELFTWQKAATQFIEVYQKILLS